MACTRMSLVERCSTGIEGSCLFPFSRKPSPPAPAPSVLYESVECTFYHGALPLATSASAACSTTQISAPPIYNDVMLSGTLTVSSQFSVSSALFSLVRPPSAQGPAQGLGGICSHAPLVSSNLKHQLSLSVMTLSCFNEDRKFVEDF